MTRLLESESIFVLREVAAQFGNPALLFSGGKDSILVSWLARKAFYPARIPFTFIHIDTGHNFPETMEFRDWWMKELGVKLVVGSVQEAIDKGMVVEEKGYNASRNLIQTAVLLDTIEKYRFDAAIGGARRDEEKARAKERFFSHRDEFGQWDPKNQRPELWNLFNGHKRQGELSRIPHQQLDRARCVGVPDRRTGAAPFAVFRPPARCIRARRYAAGRLRFYPTTPSRGARH
jgi:sulfate adenylyltransferase subunit 2